MSRIFLFAPIAACFALTGCGDINEPEPSVTDEADTISQSFTELDTDGNGVLSQAETRDVAALEQIFEIADRDQDGSLNIAEFSHATLEGFRVSAEAARGPLFLELDADENGRITEMEAEAVPQLAANFATFDRDQSGGIDPQEYMDAQDTGLIPGENGQASNGIDR